MEVLAWDGRAGPACVIFKKSFPGILSDSPHRPTTEKPHCFILCEGASCMKLDQWIGYLQVGFWIQKPGTPQILSSIFWLENNSIKPNVKKRFFTHTQNKLYVLLYASLNFIPYLTLRQVWKQQRSVDFYYQICPKWY